MPNNIGLKIRARREALGYSQEQLAQLVGYKTRSSIAKIESGENDITQTKIYDFARALKCQPSELLTLYEFTEPDRVGLQKLSEYSSAIEYINSEKMPATTSDDELALSIIGDERKAKLLKWIAGLDADGLDRIEKILDAVELLPKA